MKVFLMRTMSVLGKESIKTNLIKEIRLDFLPNVGDIIEDVTWDDDKNSYLVEKRIFNYDNNICYLILPDLALSDIETFNEHIEIGKQNNWRE